MIRLNRRKVVPVVHLDRALKANMIARVITEHGGSPLSGWRVLDVGCGNGDIAQFFARDNTAFGVDVSDRRKPENQNFSFQVVDSERLPFADAEFDLVISNHVIEHVDDQGLHLDEIRRVLKPSGLVYLATPNRSSPFMKGHVGNQMVLLHPQMAPLFAEHGFRVHEYTVNMLREPDRYGMRFRLGRWIPRVFLLLIRRWIPSHTFVLEPA